ncbi:hypothetical protein BDV93DRAFT_574199 [Ceratobasidium sp. AG-I]|nr:hypothetical protein BDV93DRAFT_574199 [Ceratobasidium sp. AG-I]
MASQKHIQLVLFGVTYTKIGTIQRRLAWPLHKDDTLVQSGRSTDRNIYFTFFCSFPLSVRASIAFTRKPQAGQSYLYPMVML